MKMIINILVIDIEIELEINFNTLKSIKKLVIYLLQATVAYC